MRKSIHTREYRTLISELRRQREAAGLSQEEVAERLGITQSMLSKMERGERRLDYIELRAFCLAIGLKPLEFITRLEAGLA